MCKYACYVCSHTISFCKATITGEHFVQAAGEHLVATGLPFVLPMSFEKIDNNNKKTDTADTA